MKGRWCQTYFDGSSWVIGRIDNTDQRLSADLHDGSAGFASSERPEGRIAGRKLPVAMYYLRGMEIAGAERRSGAKDDDDHQSEVHDAPSDHFMVRQVQLGANESK